MIIFVFDMKMIELIEKYRIEKRLRKVELTDYCNLNKNMYAKYLAGAKMPYNVVIAMLERLDKQILIIDKI